MIELGMRYGNPSIENALEKFKKNNIMKVLIILYPQADLHFTAHWIK